MSTCVVPECPKDAANSRGWCWGHYWRWRKYGDPRGGCAGPGAPMAFLKMAATHEGAKCLLWPFAKTATGYGVVTFRDKQTTAHRAVLLMTVGEPCASDMQAAHAPGICHNPSCVNPQHLRWATPAENNQDKHLDGTRNVGERAHQAKLTADQVRAIRASSLSQRLLGIEYGVSAGAIQAIKDGKTWRHVQ